MRELNRITLVVLFAFAVAGQWACKPATQPAPATPASEKPSISQTIGKPAQLLNELEDPGFPAAGGRRPFALRD